MHLLFVRVVTWWLGYLVVMMIASEIIKNSCCGQMLDVPVFEMVKKVKALEGEVILLNNQLKNAQNKIKELERG